MNETFIQVQEKIASNPICSMFDNSPWPVDDLLPLNISLNGIPGAAEQDQTDSVLPQQALEHHCPR